MLCPKCETEASGYILQHDKYLLYPCYCQVSPAWVAVFATEMNRRKNGQPPIDIAAKGKAARMQEIENLLAEYATQVNLRNAAIIANDNEHRLKYEKQMLELYKAMLPLLPADDLPVDMNLHTSTVLYAKQASMPLPSENTPSDDFKALTLGMIQATLVDDPYYRDVPAANLRALAMTVQEQLLDFVTKQIPLGTEAADILTRINPKCRDTLPVTKSSKPLLDKRQPRPRRRFVDFIPQPADDDEDDASLPRNRLRDGTPQSEEPD